MRDIDQLIIPVFCKSTLDWKYRKAVENHREVVEAWALMKTAEQ